MKFRNITISGDIGTGKTTLAKNLAQKLGWKQLHAGEYFRNWHKEHNLSLEETEKIPEEIDRQLDSKYQQMMREEEKTIFESRLAGFLAKNLKDVFKVLVTSDFNVSMERAAKRDKVSLDEATKEAKKRSDALNRKFKKLYGIDNHLDPKYFDLIIDTTNKTPQEVLEMVLKKLSEV